MRCLRCFNGLWSDSIQSMNNPQTKEDLDIYNLTYGSKIKHEVEFAQAILEELSKITDCGTYAPLSVGLGTASNPNNIEDTVSDIKHFFVVELTKKGLVKNLQTAGSDPDNYHKAYIIKFDADVQPLTEYLKKFVATDGGQQEVIWFEPDYGFYKADKNQYVPYTENGKSKKSFNVLMAVSNNELSASELSREAKLARPNMASDTCKRINDQFKKHCGVRDSLIQRDTTSGKYRINSKYVIREVKKHLNIS